MYQGLYNLQIAFLTKINNLNLITKTSNEVFLLTLNNPSYDLLISVIISPDFN